MKIEDHYQDFLFHMAKEMYPICNSLFKKTPIEYVEYKRYRDDAYCIVFSTYPELIVALFENGLFSTYDECQQVIASGRRIVLFSDILPASKIISAPATISKWFKNVTVSSALNCYHRIYFFSRHSNYFQSFGFGLHHDDRNIFDFYLNSTPLLKQFMCYFETKVPAFIKNLPNQEGLFLPNYYQSLIGSGHTRSITSDNSFEPDYFRIHLEEKEIVLSKREVDCMRLRLKHYSSHLIAEMLGITSRTVDTHIHITKKKLGNIRMHMVQEIFEQFNLIV